MTIDLGSPVVSTIAPAGAAFYRVESDAGRFTVQLAASGFPARVSLLDARGQPLVQSDQAGSGSGSGSGGDAIDVNVPAGTEYLEVQSLGAGGSYRLAASLIAADAAFAPISLPSYTPMAVADIDGDGIPDLITAAGVRPGVGDGTFQAAAVGDPVAGPDSSVTAIAAADFNGDGRADLAILETVTGEGGTTTSDVHILLNLGGGRLGDGGTIPVDPDFGSIQAIDAGGGVVDLVLTSYFDNRVAVLQGDGAGGFALGASLDTGTNPTAVAAGRFGDGHLDLVVAYQGDPYGGISPGLSVFQEDGRGQFQPSATIPLDIVPSAIVAGDFKGDGGTELAVAGDDPNNLSQAGSVTILAGDGYGSFRLQGAASYALGVNPSALLAVSIRGNGRLDLVAANSNSADVSVLLGNGDGTFEPEARYATGTSPEALFAADLNRDGRPDLVVFNVQGNDLSVLIGRGDGTFQDPTENPAGEAPLGVAVADLNRDGISDIVTANFSSDDISVLLGHGDGTFQPARSFAAGAAPTAVVFGDFNDDQRLDVAVADAGNADGGPGVTILLGDGDGGFLPLKSYPTAGQAFSIVAGDFNGDGKTDLAVLGSDSSVTILLGDGRGDFAEQPRISLGSLTNGSVSMVAGDFNGDGKTDLAVANEYSDNVSILLGDGRGGFLVQPPIPLADPDDTLVSMVAGDFNGDGKTDLAVLGSNQNDGSGNVSILEGDGQGGFDLLPTIPLEANLYPTSLTSGDFNGDGAHELAVANDGSGTIVLLQGDGQGGFQKSSFDLAISGTPTAIASGDFNNDGKTDLAIAREAPTSVAIELSQGGGNFADPGSVALSPRNNPLVADLDGDGKLDITVVDGDGAILFRRGDPGQPGGYDPPITINPGLPSRDIALLATPQGTVLASVNARDDDVSLFSYRNGQFVLMRSLGTGQGPAQVVAADLLGTGSADDLIIRNSVDGTLTLYLGNLLGASPTRIELATGVGTSDLSVADINGDGLPDILLANQDTGEVEVMLNLGEGRFASPALYRAGTGLMGLTGATDTAPAAVASMEGTVGVLAVALKTGGPPGLLTLNPGSATLGILSGLGGGRFANPIALKTTGEDSIVRAADFNGDGDIDLAILGTDGLTIRLGNGRGALFLAHTYNVGPDPTGLTIADVNGDGIPDLVVGDAAGDILILLGDGQGAFHSPSADDGSVSLAVAKLQDGSATSFVFADRAGDRIVASTGVTASAQSAVLGDRGTGLVVPGAPVLADLNGDGIPDLIVANGGGDSVLIFPGLGGGAYGPALNGGSGIFTGTDPGAVIVADVNGDGKPDLVVANTGSNDVSILLNESRGPDFSFVQGPVLQAGYGPTSLAFGDFNGDGIPDIAVSDSSSKDLTILPGVGNGFFNDGGATTIPLAQSPGQIVPGNFGPGPGLDLAVLNPGTGSVTLISGLWTGLPTSRIFSSGGQDPVAGLAVAGPDGYDDLVVANKADGRVALLEGGPLGLSVEEVDRSLSLPSPTSLAFGSMQDGSLSVYAATEGQEAAALLVFSLGGQNISLADLATGQGLTLLPSEDSSLPLIATLLTTFVNLDTVGVIPASGESPQVPAALAVPPGPSAGQSLSSAPVEDDQGDDEVIEEPEDDPPPSEDDIQKPALPPWMRSVLGLDEAFDEFRLKDQAAPGAVPGPQVTPGAGQNPPAAPTPVPASRRPGGPSDSGGLGRGVGPERPEVIDAAVEAIAEDLLGLSASAMVPGFLGFDGPILQGPPEPRLEPDPMPAISQAILLGGLFLAANRPGRPFHRRRFTLAWRMSSATSQPVACRTSRP